MDETMVARALAIREFNRFYTNLIGLVDKTILKSPYSLAEVRTLLEISIAGECKANELTRILQIDPGYLSRMIKRFKVDDLVTATKSPNDARQQLLSLTDKGQTTLNQLSDASTQQIITLLRGIPEARQEQLVNHMGGIQAILSPQNSRPIVIREQKPGDAGYIAFRHGVLYAREQGLDEVFEQYVLASLTKFMEEKQSGRIWVAERDGQRVGFIAIVGTDQETAQLRWFLIEPELRGLGLGRQLMTIAMDYCRQQGYKHVYLWTYVGLDAARHLYKSFGFSPTEQVKNDTWKNGLLEERWDIELHD